MLEIRKNNIYLALNPSTACSIACRCLKLICGEIINFYKCNNLEKFPLLILIEIFLILSCILEINKLLKISNYDEYDEVKFISYLFKKLPCNMAHIF